MRVIYKNQIKAKKRKLNENLPKRIVSAPVSNTDAKCGHGVIKKWCTACRYAK